MKSLGETNNSNLQQGLSSLTKTAMLTRRPVQVTYTLKQIVQTCTRCASIWPTLAKLVVEPCNMTDQRMTAMLQEVLRKYYLPTLERWVDEINNNPYHHGKETVEDLIEGLQINYVLETEGWAPHVNTNRHSVYTHTCVQQGIPVSSRCSWDGRTVPTVKVKDVEHPYDGSSIVSLVLWGPKIYLSGYGRYEGLEIAQKLRDLYK